MNIKNTMLMGVATLLALVGPVQAEVIVNDRFDHVLFAWVPCANDGYGELVRAEGMFHILIREDIDKSGRSHFGIQRQPMGMSAEGETTGDVYNTVGKSKEDVTFAADGLPITYDAVINNRLIGRGADAVKFNVHETVRVTYDADGEVSTSVVKTRITCE